MILSNAELHGNKSILTPLQSLSKYIRENEIFARVGRINNIIKEFLLTAPSAHKVFVILLVMLFFQFFLYDFSLDEYLDF